MTVWDCHMHLFGPAARYPLAPAVSYRPTPAALADYDRVAAPLGLTRSVIVQPSVYGADNRLTLETLDANADRFRGIIVTDRPLSPAQIEALHARGVRGVRFNTVQKGGPGSGPILETARALPGTGWSVQIVGSPTACLDFIEQLPQDLDRIVLDHFMFLPPVGAQAECAALLRLMESGRIWVKLSGAYRLSRTGAPGYADMGALARRLAERRPDRLVWGTDWPHPDFDGPPPRAADLFAALSGWELADETLQSILTDAPAHLYG